MKAFYRGLVDTLTLRDMEGDLIGPRHPIDRRTGNPRRNFADDLGNLANIVGRIVNKVTYVYAAHGTSLFPNS
jgi:hypothetical protein